MARLHKLPGWRDCFVIIEDDRVPIIPSWSEKLAKLRKSRIFKDLENWGAHQLQRTSQVQGGELYA